ncbi:unnamed protein product [Anisakis simplex]|uniref:DEK_C domain-containing protein n=1 Tax=Anisakis simplex TaxID=6269 RepID=A0A0M3JB37_ANISI|nr:unnamed protein product [Anisakis simplex]
MLDMLSLAADLHRLEFLKDNVKLKQPKDAFSKVQVRKLYEIVTSSLDYSAVASKLNDTTETTNSLPDTPPPESRKRPTESSDNNDDKDDQSESSLPPTPPPQETPAKSVKCEDDSEENDHETKNASGDIQMKSAEKSSAPKPKAANTVTPKKRKLRF